MGVENIVIIKLEENHRLNYKKDKKIVSNAFTVTKNQERQKIKHVKENI